LLAAAFCAADAADAADAAAAGRAPMRPPRPRPWAGCRRLETHLMPTRRAGRGAGCAV